MLGRAFALPDILRKPTDHILTQFVVSGRRFLALWYTLPELINIRVVDLTAHPVCLIDALP
jgi:hypothetical protein